MSGHDGKGLLWIAEDMAALESGAPYGPGLDGFGLAPERLVTVTAAHRRNLLWAMEEALRCRVVGVVIGEMRHGALDAVAARRLSLAAADTGALALLLRASPEHDASTAATRWVVAAAPSTVIPGRERSERTRNPETNSELASGFRAPASGRPRNDQETTARVLAQLTRNRRGPRGQWILEWSGSDRDGRFTCAAHAQPVAVPPVHRPHRQVA
jgi:protein ImuA